MKLETLLFSFNGRIGRAEYWIGMFLSFLVSFVGGLIWAGSNNGGSPASFGLFIAASLLLCGTIMTLAVMVKRCHDLNASGWLSLLAFVPLVGLVLAITLGTIASKYNYEYTVENDEPTAPHGNSNTQKAATKKSLADSKKATDITRKLENLKYMRAAKAMEYRPELVRIFQELNADTYLEQRLFGKVDEKPAISINDLLAEAAAIHEHRFKVFENDHLNILLRRAYDEGNLETYNQTRDMISFYGEDADFTVVENSFLKILHETTKPLPIKAFGQCGFRFSDGTIELETFTGPKKFDSMEEARRYFKG